MWLANETLDRTDLGAFCVVMHIAKSDDLLLRKGERKVGDQLNLERAMGAHVRFGGHFVQVHARVRNTVPMLICLSGSRRRYSDLNLPCSRWRCPSFDSSIS